MVEPLPLQKKCPFYPAGFFCLLALLFLLGTSCSGVSFGSRISGKLMLLRGNFFNAQSMYTEAILAYLEALEFAETAPYAEYGLGLVYLSLDEGVAALQHFAAAEEGLTDLMREDHRELIYRIYYNRGVVRFHAGDFAAAVDQFRTALETDGSRIEAKRNLELSLLSLSHQNSGASSTLSLNLQEQQKGPQVLFDYIRRKEQDLWKSREWSADTDSAGPDY
ncbi:tetratricopeptide repeat protein [Treponema primitia]|uniref:tetratricopeptide repeat protein n=1 Tax=Treponema primitia TaxID=88058 RepID=UPI0039811A7E